MTSVLTLEKDWKSDEATNILQASRKHKVKKVIYSSTSACYGLSNEPPLHEEMKTDCLNPYSVTKVAAEDICEM